MRIAVAAPTSGEHEQCTDHWTASETVMAIKTRKTIASKRTGTPRASATSGSNELNNNGLNSTSSNANVWMLAIAVISILVRLMPTICPNRMLYTCCANPA